MLMYDEIPFRSHCQKDPQEKNCYVCSSNGVCGGHSGIIVVGFLIITLTNTWKSRQTTLNPFPDAGKQSTVTSS